MAAAVSQLCVWQGSTLLDCFIQHKGCKVEQISPLFHLYLYLFFKFRRASVLFYAKQSTVQIPTQSIKCHTEQDSEQDSIPGTTLRTTFRTTFRPSLISLLHHLPMISGNLTLISQNSITKTTVWHKKFSHIPHNFVNKMRLVLIFHTLHTDIVFLVCLFSSFTYDFWKSDTYSTKKHHKDYSLEQKLFSHL